MKKAVELSVGDIIKFVSPPDPNHSDSANLVGHYGQVRKVVAEHFRDLTISVNVDTGVSWACLKNSLEIVQKNLINEGGETNEKSS